MPFDLIVVGGSYAGLAAALQVARARRRVLVIDAGQPRNRFALASHGFLGQDGRAPGAILSDARTQLQAYPTVDWIDGRAIKAEGVLNDFSVTMAGGEHQRGRRLVLATGVADILPEIPGLRPRWGRSVVHCPYCHGYEFAGGQLGVLATGAAAMHHALLVPDWGPTTLFLNDAFAPDADQLTELTQRGVAIERTPVAALSGDSGVTVELADGRTIALAGLFTLLRTEMTSPLAGQLGCRIEDMPFGPIIATDDMKATSVPGVYACGDAARAMSSVTFAVADGAMAGVAAHRSLVFPATAARG